MLSLYFLLWRRLYRRGGGMVEPGGDGRRVRLSGWALKVRVACLMVSRAV